MQHPKKIETVHVETLEGELCIYDWQRMEVHNLNPTHRRHRLATVRRPDQPTANSQPT